MKKYGLWVFALPVALVLSACYFLLAIEGFALWFIPPIDLTLRVLWGVSWLLALISLGFRLVGLINRGARLGGESGSAPLSPLPFHLALGTLTVMVLLPIGYATSVALFMTAPVEYSRSADGRHYSIGSFSYDWGGGASYAVRGGIFREVREDPDMDEWYQPTPSIEQPAPADSAGGGSPDYSSYLMDRASNSSGDYAVLQPGYVSVAKFDGSGVPQDLYTFTEAGEADPDYFAAHDPDTLVLSLATAAGATPYYSVDGGYTWATLPEPLLAEFPEAARYTLDSQVEGQTIRLLLGHPAWNDAIIRGDEGASAWVVSQDAGATWALEERAGTGAGS